MSNTDKVCLLAGLMMLLFLGYCWQAAQQKGEIPHRIQFEYVGGEAEPSTTTNPAAKEGIQQRWTQREVECLAQNIYHEARGEPVAGQVAVAYVVINRVARRLRGDDVCEVVWAPHQFSWTSNPRPIRDQKAWEKAWRVATLVMNQAVENPVGPADHYHATSVKPNWAKKLKKVAKIGHHIFYF